MRKKHCNKSGITMGSFVMADLCELVSVLSSSTVIREYCPGHRLVSIAVDWPFSRTHRTCCRIKAEDHHSSFLKART